MKHLVASYLSLLGRMVVLGALFGAIAGAWIVNPPLLGAGLVGLSAVIDTTSMGALIGGAEIFLPRTRFGQVLERSPFVVVFAVKAVAYCAVIFAIVLGRLGPKVVLLLVDAELANLMNSQLDAKFPLGLLVPTALMGTFFVLLLFQLRQLVGEATLRDIVLGRYHRARTEERFFLFVDIVGSTPLAERIGPVAVNRFLARVFKIASDPVDDHAGDIYQYVGDEMVVTWKVSVGQICARPLACFFAIQQALETVHGDFEREFGAVPHLRGAVHAGQVIAGEVGGTRRAIVFHGDVMNTTSRIENATRDLNRIFLVSEDALNQIAGKGAYAFEDLGLQQLRGREAKMRLYAVELVVDGPEAALHQ